jgi:ankyrin repeat protein
MQSVSPKYIVALVVAVALFAALKLLNPYREYSTRQYWETATLASVDEIPAEALKEGNKNGSVLMWAAMSNPDTAVIRALVERGADVNEADPLFSGTPLTGAAGYSKYPEIIKELVALGADINKRVNNKETALMITAQYNTNPGIAEELVSLGADINSKNAQGKTALDLARTHKNQVVETALIALMREN